MQSLLSCRVKVPEKRNFPIIQGAILMKTILVAVVLGGAVIAWAQNPAQPAQGQQPTAQPAPAQGQAAAPSQPAAPVIKDPAEYNAYVAAVQATDPNAKVSGLEAFLNQYPNSVMKNQALEILMQTYQQTGNIKKTLDTGTKLVTADPCNVRALTLLAYFDRVSAQSGDPNAQQLLADGKKYGQQGLDCLPKQTDPDIVKMKDQMTGIFHAAVGISCLQSKDYACAIDNLKPAVEAGPDSQKDFSLVYPLALAYWPDVKTPTTPENSMNAIWYAARASALAPPQAQAQIEKYARSLYRHYHGAEDGWDAVLAQAKSGPTVPDLASLIKPAPTPAEQAHDMVTKTSPDKMDFATWEFVLSNGSQADQDAVWNAIKGKAVQMVGTVIGTEPTQFMVAGSEDDIEAKKADITLKFADKVPVRLIPKDGDANFQFQGEPASYTPNPFMMVMENAKLLNAKPAAPAHKAPAHRAAQ
jgi:hypothetical protein